FRAGSPANGAQAGWHDACFSDCGDGQRPRIRKGNRTMRHVRLSVACLACLPAAPALAAEAVPDKGDTAFMMLATLLVLLMLLPGLALFYGGLMRARNMLSVLMQCTMVGAVAMVAWVAYGYSFAFGGLDNPFFGGVSKLFLAGVTLETTVPTFSEGVVIPELVFVAFQMTFAAITPALIVGAFAERIRFSAVMLFTPLWLTLAYFPVAHMVWDGS